MSLTTVQNMMIGVVLCIVIVIGGGMFLSSFNTVDSTIDPTNKINEFNSTLNKANDVTNSVNNIRNSIESFNPLNPLSYFDVLLRSVYNGLKAMFSSLDFIGTSLSSGMAMLGFGDLNPLILLIGLIVIIILGFAIYAAISKVNV